MTCYRSGQEQDARAHRGYRVQTNLFFLVQGEGAVDERERGNVQRVDLVDELWHPVSRFFVRVCPCCGIQGHGCSPVRHVPGATLCVLSGVQ